MEVLNRSPLSRIQRTDTTLPSVFDLDSPVPNIIVFGETGVGKSSIINMLQGEEAATTSNSAYGCTRGSSYHEVTLASLARGEKKYRLWDTSGLNEGDKGTVPAQKAIANLVTLVRQLRSSAGGVSLLVYCIRGARLREIIRVNYDLFGGIICNGQVPIVLVVTGLENEDDMENWWRDNCAELEEVMRMKFDGHACVTSTKGKLNKSGYVFEEEYQESVGKVRFLLESTCTLQPEPFRIEGERWIADIQMRLEHYMSEYNQRTGQERRAVEGGRNTVRSESQDFGRHVSEYHPGTGQGRAQDPGWLQLFADLLAFLRMTWPRHASGIGASMQPPPYSHGSQQDPSNRRSATPSVHQQVQGYTQASVSNSNDVPGTYAGTIAPI